MKPVTPGPLSERTPTTRPVPLDTEGEPAYMVQKILDSCQREGIALQWLIEWEGDGPEEKSRILAHDVLDPMLCQEFHAHHPYLPGPWPNYRDTHLYTITATQYLRTHFPQLTVKYPVCVYTSQYQALLLSLSSWSSGLVLPFMFFSVA